MTILFLCTGNSCRSQMAEGWARTLWQGQHQALSAGTHPQGMNPITITVMAEVGIDISDQWSKSVDDINLASVDVLATVCDSAHETCPVLPGVPLSVHRSFEDPYRAGQDPQADETLELYRRVRDEIRDWVAELPGKLASPATHPAS